MVARTADLRCEWTMGPLACPSSMAAGRSKSPFYFQKQRKHFAPVNSGALPEGILESELFGHVEGAFTGATGRKKGRFELADGGSIFLDEVGELRPEIQVKLLRVLQDGAFEPLGAEKTIRVDVRVISATNKKLEEEVKNGGFRRDLYYRLCVIPISVPALRDRPEDVPILTEHFLARYSDPSFQKKVTLSPMVKSILMAHSWPGNVRELQNAIQYALVKCQGQTVEPEHLPPTLRHATAVLPRVKRRKAKLGSIEVAEALRRAGGNKGKAAEILGVSRATLYRFFATRETTGIDY